MKVRCSKEELFLVVAAVVLSFVLRTSRLNRLAVEHFDEGVYASATWYDSSHGDVYPMRHLYAPPLLPWLIRTIATIPGLEETAPFLPSILLGSLTVPLLWWMARTWFGMNAGLFIVFLAAFSDFHILFSRMALTDVPVLFWTILAVGLAARALHSQSARGMIVAGLCAGIAWWTKYTGWLALAIVTTGSTFWWLVRGRQRISAVTTIRLVFAFCATAGIVWLPWYIALQDYGGYEAVARNHAGYFRGISGWQDRLADHLMYHFRFDSWFGAASIGLGMLVAGTRRWIELCRSTWKQSEGTGEGTPENAVSEVADNNVTLSSSDGRFPPPALLGRFIGASIVLAVLASGVGAVGLLICLGIGGLAGMFLWPVMSELYQRRCELDRSPSCEGGLPFRQQDLNAAPAIDPMIGTCFTIVWLGGMIVMTPMYHPYPRLSLPLLASLWLAAAGGAGWWMEANLNTHRRREETDARRPSVVRRAAQGMLIAALAMTLAGAGSFATPLIWQNRTSLRDASWHLAKTAIDHATGQLAEPDVQLNLTSGELISPEPETETFDSEQAAAPARQLQDRIALPFDTANALADPAQPECAVFCYGEPAVLWHLDQAGIPVAPVQDTGFPPALLNGRPLPTYLVLGPNALRTDGMLNDWATDQYRFEHVADFYFTPGEVVLYNLFSPVWIGQHFEAAVQKLELYRLKD